MIPVMICRCGHHASKHFEFFDLEKALAWEPNRPFASKGCSVCVDCGMFENVQEGYK